ncbi:MAG TPA: hypothetical protein VIS99_06725 [Terrimicrobiaceae bacterium]
MTSIPSSTPSRGVYILGNDHVLEYAICLFRSLRNHSPDIPARLLPYDGQLTKLRPWMQRYQIELHSDPDYAFFDKLGANLWETTDPGHRMFRKFSAYAGPFEEFLYLDIDIAVLAPVEKLFEAFACSGAEFMTFDNDLDNVYRRTPWTDEMDRTGRTRGFNAGAFLSKRGLFTRADLLKLLASARQHRENFVFQFDQPFFNFAVDTKPLRQVRLPEFDRTVPDKLWGDQVPIGYRDGAWRLLTPGHADYGKAEPLIHWAGHSGGDPFPNRHIFYHYRLLGEPFTKRAAYCLADHWRWHIGQPLKRLRDWSLHKWMRLRMETGKLLPCSQPGRAA